MEKFFALFGKVIIFIVTLAIVLGGAYYLGRNSIPKNDVITPTVSPSITPRLSPTITLIPTPTTAVITPTKKVVPTIIHITPTATPTPTKTINFKPFFVPTATPTPTVSKIQINPSIIKQNQNQSM